MSAVALARVGLLSAPAHAGTVVLGSKRFTESYVLGEIGRRVLERRGLPVELRQGMAAPSFSGARCAPAPSRPTPTTPGRSPPRSFGRRSLSTRRRVCRPSFSTGRTPGSRCAPPTVSALAGSAPSSTRSLLVSIPFLGISARTANVALFSTVGEPIISGLNLNDQRTILQGALPAAPALLIQLLFSALVPRGMRRGRR